MKSFRFIIVVFFMLIASFCLRAQISPWRMGVQVGREYFNKSGEELKSGWCAGLELRYYMTDRFYSLGSVAYGLASTSFPSGYINDSGNNESAHIRRHSVLPSVGLGYDFLIGDFYSCYMQGGIGYGIEYNKVSYPQDSSSSKKGVGWLAELGGDYFLRDDLSIGVSIAHLRVGFRNNWTGNIKLAFSL